MFIQLSAEKETRTTAKQFKKQREREQRKWNFLNFYNEPINLPQFF